MGNILSVLHISYWECFFICTIQRDSDGSDSMGGGVSCMVSAVLGNWGVW